MGPEDEDYRLEEILRLLNRNSYDYFSTAAKRTASLQTPPVAKAHSDASTEGAVLRKQLCNQISEGFRRELESLHGACYATEVRDTGVEVCGVHYVLWSGSEDDCSRMEQELELLREVVSRKLATMAIGKSTVLDGSEADPFEGKL